MSTRLPNSKTVIARLAQDAPRVLESAGMPRTAIAAQLVHRRKDYEPSLGEELARTAILSGDEERALIQIERCANPNAADNLGVSLLHHAAQMGLLRVCERLLERGANPCAVTALGEPVITYVMSCNSTPGQPRNHMPGIMRLLLADGARADQPDAVDGSLPEHVAARLGDTTALAVLYNSLGRFQKQTLVLAALSGQTQPVRFLLWAGTDPRLDLAAETWPRGSVKQLINPQTHYGRTMASISDMLARGETIAYARQRAGLPIEGADLTQVPNLRRELQDVALIMRGHDDMPCFEQALLMLGEMKGYKPALKNGPQDMLYRGAATNHIPMLVSALAKGARLDTPNQYGHTAYAIAAMQASLAAMETIRRVEAAHPDIPDTRDFPDVLGRTPLMQNALAGNVLVVGKLLVQGASPLLTDYAGHSARQLVADLVLHLQDKNALEPAMAQEYEAITHLLEVAEASRANNKPKRQPVARLVH
jgi:ankyrin repeat protein